MVNFAHKLGYNCCMAYEIQIRKTALKALNRIQHPYREKIEDAIDNLAEVPRPFGAKKLAASDGLYRIRIIDYRIIYSINDQIRIVSIERIGHRKAIYKEL